MGTTGDEQLMDQLAIDEDLPPLERLRTYSDSDIAQQVIAEQVARCERLLAAADGTRDGSGPLDGLGDYLQQRELRDVLADFPAFGAAAARAARRSAAAAADATDAADASEALLACLRPLLPR